MGTRSNAGAGAAVLIGGVAVAMASQQPWVSITGPSLGITLKDVVDVGIAPRGTDTGDTEERQLLLAVGAGLAICGVLLMLTRVRVVGPLLRLFTLTLAAIPAFLAISVWAAVGETAGDVFDDPEASFVDKARAGVGGLLESLGVITIQPAIGLYVLSAGSVAVLLGCLIPARRLVDPSLRYRESLAPPRQPQY